MEQNRAMQGVREAIEAASHKLGSQGKLAEALGVHSNTISGWKNGSRDPGTKMLVRIFELGELSMDSLFSLPASDTNTATPADLASLRADIEQLKQGQALIMEPLKSFIANLLALSSITPKVQDSIEPLPALRDSSSSSQDNRQRIAASTMQAVDELKNKRREPTQKPLAAPLKKVSGG
jgi:transcriptional regulator with XRE-family HTH domain